MSAKDNWREIRMDQNGPGRPDAVTVVPIGHVLSPRSELRDDDWGDIPAVIRLDSTRFDAQALLGLEGFSHLEVVFHFHRVPEEEIETGSRRPRGNADWPLVGIFAQRGKNRPNRLGVSRCALVKLDGTDIYVLGLDAVEGTPVLDIKPYFDEFGPRGGVRQPPWSVELMSRYY